MSFLNAIPGWKYLSAGVGVLALLFLGWLLLKAFVIGPRDLHAVERDAMLEACAQLADKLVLHADATNRRSITIALPPVKGDTSGSEVHFALKGIINSRERLKVAEDGVLTEAKGSIKEWLVGTSPSPSPETLLSQKGELHGVLLVEVHNLSTRREATSKFDTVLHEWKLDEQQKRVEGQFQTTPIAVKAVIDYETGKPVKEGSEEEAGKPGFWSGLGWLLISVVCALAIPFAFLPLTDFVTGKRHNVLGIAYLAVIVLVSMVPWYLLMIRPVDGGAGWQWLAGLGLLIGTGFWTYSMHDAWSERR